ncbi:MAG: dihydrofolate reductase [Halioglobus sp.]|nr:dihydrofolate reductase [Halioglobus sp.]
MPEVALIAAVAENGVIGRDNGLPWHLPADLAYFKRVTLGKPIIMGRKTFVSIGRPLPGRSSIVISRNAQFMAPGCSVVSSLDIALVLADDIARNDNVSEAVVIGGAEIYAAALPLADRLYLTEVHASVDGDAWFPRFDRSQWRECSRDRQPAGASNPYDYSFVVYERVER